MTNFATILDSLEKATRPTERDAGPLRPPPMGTLLREKATPSPLSQEDRAARISRAYGVEPAMPREPPPAPPQPKFARLPEREEALVELQRAEGSLAKLGALRRRLAWACHPDRQEKSRARQAERLLAEFNAQIDQAVARANARNARR
ncbi:hypothetical protein MSC49_15770 [Methylosinus sp. C49]|uniref:hypothetical protein n=1 Tax=Methylosinus sp. C49 TaxID=2699395 RepID=UPI001366EFD9|nr:hypothetical protein [Methylosinus sp. C49]BBU61642.1 hypothetical protein MSC49_15770 [Methylosinus sp. C49]